VKEKACRLRIEPHALKSPFVFSRHALDRRRRNFSRPDSDGHRYLAGSQALDRPASSSSGGPALRRLRHAADYGLALEFTDVETTDGHVLKTIIATRATNMGAAERTRRMDERLRAKGIKRTGESRGTIILLHGRGGLKENMLTVAQRFIAADFRCIAYDARAHGESGGEFCTFGKKETDDLSRVLDFYEVNLKNRGESLGPVCAFGNSLGASVALQSLNRENRIVAVAAAAPFADLAEVVSHSGRKMVHPRLPQWLLDTSMRVGGWRADFDPFAISPLREVALSDKPLLLAHGTLDTVIPIDHSYRIRETSISTPLIWKEIPTAYHYNILAEGGDDLYQQIIEFFLSSVRS